MIAEHQYPLDPNGIPIKPGYRQPFNSETGREAAFKCARARARLVEDAKIARIALRQIHELLTKNKSRKSLSKPRSATNHAVSTRDSKPASNSTIKRPRLAKQNASVSVLERSGTVESSAPLSSPSKEIKTSPGSI